MRSFYARGVAGAILLASLASVALAQDSGLPSLFPLPPPAPSFNVVQTAASDALWYQGVPSPAQEVGPSPSDRSVISPDYMDAMKGGYEGCPTCGTGCGHNHYVYANALVMTHDKRGGFVTSVDSATFTPEVFFCNPGFGDLWHGGVEVGTGWCFGCDSRTALEVVYWGLYPAAHTDSATGSLDSLIDFSDLDYNGGSGNDAFTGSQVQQVEYGFNFNSVEFNLVGNCCGGGPFGCGMCGCCYGNNGSPWGIGWTAGFRYINFNENWVFSGDTTDQFINGDATELNYRVQLNNNLFGFQMGSGISYCLTDRLSAYAIAKFGVYDNYVTQSQRIFGSAGNATINNGPNSGLDFNLTGSDNDLSFVGQFDLGGRWNINESWSLTGGYRLVGLTGVAIAETNVQNGNLQNLLGIADTQTTGSFVMHGAYVGVTYSW